MKRYNKYNIKEADHFDPSCFQKVTNELDAMRLVIALYPGPFCELIVISFLKSRKLEPEWIDANPGLSGMMAEGTCSTTELESLFASCRANPVFTREFEEYIRKQIAAIPMAGTPD